MYDENRVKHEMRAQYKRGDLGKGVRGKYFSAHAETHNIVLLDPEVAKAFSTEEAVNEALLSRSRWRGRRPVRRSVRNDGI